MEGGVVVDPVSSESDEMLSNVKVAVERDSVEDRTSQIAFSSASISSSDDGEFRVSSLLSMKVPESQTNGNQHGYVGLITCECRVSVTIDCSQ